MQVSFRQITDKSIFVGKELLVLVMMIVGGILLAGLFGAFVGLLIAMFLARSYKKHGSSDPADAPVYVGIGFVAIGAALGVLLGLSLGLLLYILRFVRNSQAALSGEIAL